MVHNHYKLQQSIYNIGGDITVPPYLNIALSEGNRVAVPVDIIDDLITEREEECERLYLAQELDYASLYDVNPKQKEVLICIRDNDSES